MRLPTPAPRPRPAKPLWLLALSLALSACASPAATPMPSPTLPAISATPPAAAATEPPAPSATAVASATALPPATATAVPPTFTPVPPTPAPARVVLLSTEETQVKALQAAIQQVAQKFGWQADTVEAPAPAAVRAAAQAGAAVIVADGPALEAEARAAASDFPAIYFICLHLTGTGLPSNLLALGDTPREDQAGFLAGMAAGLATHVKRVAVISNPTSPSGLRYRNGFLHGVRYTCPRCRLDNIDVMNAADSADTVDNAAKYRLFGVDVFFAAAGDTGNAALVKVTQAGAWGLGSGGDVALTLFNGGATAGADKILTSVYLDPAAAVSSALAQFHAGTPLTGTQSLSAATGALIVAPVRVAAGGLSPLDQQDLATTLSRLADGSFETGIDPVTGAER